MHGPVRGSKWSRNQAPSGLGPYRHVSMNGGGVKHRRGRGCFVNLESRERRGLHELLAQPPLVLEEQDCTELAEAVGAVLERARRSLPGRRRGRRQRGRPDASSRRGRSSPGSCRAHHDGLLSVLWSLARGQRASGSPRLHPGRPTGVAGSAAVLRIILSATRPTRVAGDGGWIASPTMT
jgi:hypothetical protein